MKTRTLLLGLLLFGLWCSTSYGGDLIVGEPYLQPKASSAHRSLTATVMRIESGMVFLRTEERTIRNVALTEVQRDGMPSLQPGDEVDLILDKGNSVLAIAPPRGTGAFIGDDVVGTVQLFDGLNKRITLKTEEGEIQSFELRGAVSAKLNGVKKGRAIILEMDGQHRAFDAYRAE